MPRAFNTAGPCKPDIHYMLPPDRRVPGLRALIDGQSYFVIHAPRQSGKTTALMALARDLTASGRYTSVVLTMETGEPFREDLEGLEPAILGRWRMTCRAHLPAELQPPPWPAAARGARIGAALSEWSLASARPLVLFLDEIDALQDEALLTVLRQIRGGYADRPQAFPASLGLVGLRDVRDYKVASGGSGRLGTASPFNIKVGSFTLANFTPDDVAELYAQHTAETGQAFDPPALAAAWELTQGQPWLVNAIARECVLVLRSEGATVTAADVEQAAENLMRRMDTHLDSLAEKLHEGRVRAVIEPILSGGAAENVPMDDIQYVLDLGLVRRAPDGGLVVANAIYTAVIPRMLAFVPRHGLPQIPATWLRPDGSLDDALLLDAFLSFWRQYGEAMQRTASYAEVAAQLIVLAYLDRVANGGGWVTPEYSLGRDRLDLCLRWRQQRVAVELKAWRDGRPDPERAGLTQLDGYLGKLGLDCGWLMIFDQRSGLLPIEQRTSTCQVVSPAGRKVMVIRG